MRKVASIAILALLICSAALAQDVAAKRDAAEKAARSWLALVDRGEYGQSWEQAASFFKSKVTKAGWESAAEQVRAPLGAVGNRTLAGSVYRTDLPGAPSGEYVVIQYKTEFANGESAVETITPMLDSDGQWRVSGYFVKPAQ
jgi:hypothetical protein